MEGRRCLHSCGVALQSLRTHKLNREICVQKRWTNPIRTKEKEIWYLTGSKAIDSGGQNRERHKHFNASNANEEISVLWAEKKIHELKMKGRMNGRAAVTGISMTASEKFPLGWTAAGRPKICSHGSGKRANHRLSITDSFVWTRRESLPSFFP